MAPHVHVHRGREQQRRARREHERADQIVGQPGREAREAVRGGRRDDHQLGPVGERDVVDLALFGGVEQLAAHGVAGDRLQRERAHELRGRARHRAAHVVPGALQRADELRRLVGRDAAGHRQEDAPLVHGGVSLGRSQRLCEPLPQALGHERRHELVHLAAEPASAP